jgi:hypothetical protein
MRRRRWASSAFCCIARPAIRDDQLYREYDYVTFEEYCEQRWELDKGHASRLIGAAAFADKVAHGQLSLPARESHIRPLLTRLEQDENRLIGAAAFADRVANWQLSLPARESHIRRQSGTIVPVSPVGPLGPAITAARIYSPEVSTLCLAGINFCPVNIRINREFPTD